MQLPGPEGPRPSIHFTANRLGFGGHARLLMDLINPSQVYAPNL